jgi:hypothetical protein
MAGASPHCVTQTHLTVLIGMTVMVQTSAVEFQRKFGEFHHQAQRKPVEITRHSRREFVLMSPNIDSDRALQVRAIA